MGEGRWAIVLAVVVVVAAVGCGAPAREGVETEPAPRALVPTPHDGTAAPAPRPSAASPGHEEDRAVATPHYQVIGEETYDAPVKTQVVLKILVPGDTSEASLDALLRELYSSVAARRGYKYHNTPTNVFVYAFTSREFAESGMGQWIAMLAKTRSDSEPKVSFNEAQLAQRSATPEAKFGLSEDERKEFFKEIVRVEDETEGRATDDAKERLAEEYGVTRQQLDEIGVEGVLKDWPFPPRP